MPLRATALPMFPMFLLGLLLAASMLIGCVEGPDGGEVFRREGCTLCHRYKGLGHGINLIDLTGVTSRRTDGWIRDQLLNPRLHRPDTGMPSFAHLSGAEVRALIRFLHGK